MIGKIPAKSCLECENCNVYFCDHCAKILVKLPLKGRFTSALHVPTTSTI